MPESVVISGVPTAVPVYNVSTYRLPRSRRSWPRSPRGAMVLSEVFPHRHAGKKSTNMFNCSYWTLDNNFNFNPLQRSDVAICETAFHETRWRKHEEKKISVRGSEHDLIFSDKLEKGTPQSPSTIRTLRLASQLGVQPALENFKISST